MKLFLVRALGFILLIGVLLGCIEAFVVFYPSMFNMKARYIHKNKDIELLILGSSHLQDDLNPEFLEIKSANLAYGSQDIELDSALFFKYISDLHNLKFLLLELDYHTLEERNLVNYFRLPWYYKYHRIELYHLSLLNRCILFSSSPEFFKNFIIQTINPFEYKYELNKYGSVKNDFPGIFKTLDYDSGKIKISANERLKNKFSAISLENYLFNKNKMNKIIDYCILHNIKAVLVETPAYITYRETFISEKFARREEYIDSLIKTAKSNILLLNYESDARFTIKDFKNDDHLNSDGAKKFTSLINKEIKKLNFKVLE
jgi:hypothetical protein